MARVFIGLGSNIGDREATIRKAINELASLGHVEIVSPLYETDPVGYLDQPEFLNAVVELRTDWEPEEFLDQLLSIERKLGRVRSFANAPRTVDLDLLLYDDRVISTPRLIVPHPRLHERAFVLAPLADVAPDFIVPGMDRSVLQLLAEVGWSGIRNYATGENGSG